MIAFLRGTLIELEPNPSLTALATLDVNGVGYQLLLTRSCAVSVEVGQSVSFTVYTEVKEDAIRLYGFADKLERQTFLLLTEVKGIGPKSAIEVLSKVSAKELLSIIAHGDLARLKSVKGMGLKTAERVVVELKEKVNKFLTGFFATSELDSPGGQSKASKVISAVFEDALLALVALGFSKKDSERVIASIQEDKEGVLLKDSGDIVREALKRL
jgi:Holliday junction DNA helicase RuvA